MDKLTDNMMNILNNLNNKKYTLPIWYRRNHPIYPLICYVNILQGLYLSQNIEGIPVFINRIHRFFEQYSDTKTKDFEIYQQLIIDFIRQIDDGV